MVREANKAQKKRNYFKIVPSFGEKSDTQEKSLLAFFLDFDLILIVLQRRFGTRSQKMHIRVPKSRLQHDQNPGDFSYIRFFSPK